MSSPAIQGACLNAQIIEDDIIKKHSFDQNKHGMLYPERMIAHLVIVEITN